MSGMFSGGSKKESNVQQQMIDPNMYSMLWGSGAKQAVFDKNGRVTTPAKQGTGGLFGDARSLYMSGPLEYYPQDTYAGFNPLQNSAIGQSVNYLTSPNALSGYNAMNSASQSLMGGAGGAPQTGSPEAFYGSPALYGAPGQPPVTPPQQGGPIDFDATRQSYDSTMANQFQPLSVQQNMQMGQGANAGGTGVDYQGYANQLINDDSAINPHVQGLADQAMRMNTQNYLEQIAPQFRSGDRMSGMYGNSRSGIVESRGISDLNRANADAATSLFGSAWDAQQNRRAGLASAFGGFDTDRAIASAANSTQANIAQANRDLQAKLANQQAGLDFGRMGLDYDLGMRGLGLQDTAQRADYDLGMRGLGLQDFGLRADYDLGLQGLGMQGNRDAMTYDLGRRGIDVDWGNLNLGNRQLDSQNLISGANLAQQASQIPYQNLSSIFGLGQLLQGNTQGQMDADVNRWNFEQQAPWNNLMNLMSILQGNTTLGAAQSGQGSSKDKSWSLGFGF